MKECKHCHAQIKDECVFCTVCGALDEVAATSPQYSDAQPQAHAQQTQTQQAPYNPYKNTINAPVYVKKSGNPVTAAFNILYSLILFFVLVPLPWEYRTGDGFGHYGYGARQQIGKFNALMTADKTQFLKLLIGGVWILLITAVIITACFSIAALIYLNVSKKKGTNMRLLKVFNMFIAASMAFIFIVTIPYLTFTFICAFTAVFYMVLTTYKPDFVKDFLKRRGNENRNGAALMLVMLSVVFALCFSPVYDITDSWGKVTTYDFYSIIYDLRQTKPTFLGIFSAFTLIIIAAVFLYVLIQYLRGKTVHNSVPVIALGISLLLAVFIGANILVESKFGNGNLSYHLRFNYYVLLSFMLVVMTVYFVQKALDIRQHKKAAIAETEQR